MELRDGSRLAYCTNVHPGESWAETFAALERFAPALRARLAPNAAFDVGLRLSGLASRELLEGDALERFAAWLDAHELRVALINGFPHGAFHATRVKEFVHAPHWLDEERVQYTLRLARVLARLVPDGVTGGISTSPLSYRAWVRRDDEDAMRLAARNVARVAAALARERLQSGRVLHLDVEPEPDGLVESGAELEAWARDWLRPHGAPVVADALGVSRSDAEAALAEHVRVCLDTCHFAIGFEDVHESLRRFERAGIQVGRLQLSNALAVRLGADRAAVRAALEPFAEGVYLHQVVELRRDGSLRRYADLSEAWPGLADAEAVEWRVHFHVPVFAEAFGALGSTRAWLDAALAAQRARPFTRHVEVETYTWDVLPRESRLPLVDSMEREYRWVLSRLDGELDLAPAGAAGR